MAVITPPSITAMPAAPDPNDRSTFNARAYPWAVAQAVLATQVGSVATNVALNATDAATSATTATTQAALATTNGAAKVVLATSEVTKATTQSGIATAKAILTAADAVATAADRLQTSLDRVSASASAASAASVAGVLIATSATNLTVGSGSKTFAVQAGSVLPAGLWLTAVSAATPENWMFGQVTSYSGTTLTVNVQAFGGSGTFAGWALSLVGGGATSQAIGFTLSGGLTLKTLTVLLDATVSGTNTGDQAGGDTAKNIGYLNIPQNIQSAAYTMALSDSGKHILHPNTDTTARTFTVPANSSVPYPIGTAITLINDSSAGTITIAINTDTLVLAGAGTTGTRTLAANGIATAIKISATRWIVSGSGLT